MKIRSAAGFSVIELIIVMAIVWILGAIAYPSFASFGAPFRVQAAAREVYSALQDARQQAVTRGRRIRVQVVGSDSYTLEWDSLDTWRTIKGPMRVESGVQLASSGGAMTFQPRGTVSPMSTLTIADVDRPDRRVEITVPMTGLIRLRNPEE